MQPMQPGSTAYKECEKLYKVAAGFAQLYVGLWMALAQEGKADDVGGAEWRRVLEVGLRSLIDPAKLREWMVREINRPNQTGPGGAAGE